MPAEAAGTMDANNAPTAPWKTTESAMFHNPHRPHRLTFWRITITLLGDEPATC